jgi:outer membrane immunogenic protein
MADIATVSAQSGHPTATHERFRIAALQNDRLSPIPAAACCNATLKIGVVLSLGIGHARAGRVAFLEFWRWEKAAGRSEIVVNCGKNGTVQAPSSCYHGRTNLGFQVKKSLLATASIGALVVATGAHGADLSARPVYKTPPLPPQQPWNWTGFYIGGNVGGAAAHGSVSNDPATLLNWLVGQTNANRAGVIGGFEAGYNYQIANVVLGVEGDISWATINTTVPAVSIAAPGTDIYAANLDWLSTVRGRLGWAFDRVLVYGTGGAAFAKLNDQFSDSNIPFVAIPNSSVTGWTAGAGLEYAFADHWTAKAEYLHVGFPDRTGFGGVPGIQPYAFSFRDNLNIGRVGINYKF